MSRAAKLKRIEYTRESSPDGTYYDMRSKPDGRFVLYDDARQVIENLEREIQLESELPNDP